MHSLSTQWFLGATVLVMLILGFLGFTNLPHALPINDKVLHFVCLSIATGVFYFIFDVEECVSVSVSIVSSLHAY